MRGVYEMMDDLALVLRDGPFEAVDVEPMRMTSVVDDDGAVNWTFERDDILSQNLGGAIATGTSVPGRGAPRAIVPFSLELLEQMGPDQLGRTLAPKLHQALTNLS